MKPKKGNKHIWKLQNLFYTEEGWQYQTGPIGAEISHLETKEMSVYKFDVADKLYGLNLLQHNPHAGIKYVSPSFFDGVVHDMSFLDPYIDKRPSWDEYYMANAQLMAARSTCDRLYVGCVLVKNNRVIATGYNGSISGHSHCDEVGHLIVEENGRESCKRTIHAEKNAINMCAKLGISTEGATAYVTHYPCPDCMRELNQAGIKEVVYGSFYQHRYENEFHKGMTLREFKGRKATISWEE